MNYKFKTKPYKHQVVALKRAWQQGYLALLWEPGTGKTKLIVDWACALWQREKIQTIMIVCPLSVIGVWEEEFETHATVPYHFIPIDAKTKDLTIVSNDLNVVVVNYDLAWRRKELLDQLRPNMVIADESQRIKRPNARRTRFMTGLNRAPYRAVLTGTPTPKSYLDLFSQWKFLHYRTFGTRVADFRHRYIVMGGFMGKQIVGYDNVKELKQKVKKDASIVLKRTALDLPEQIYQRIPIDLEPAAQAHYDKMAYEFFLELERGDVSDAKNAAVKILRLQQITGGWIKSDEGNTYQLSEQKIKTTQDLLHDLWENDEPVVVFARFIPEVQAIAQLGADAGVRTYVLRGATGRAHRDSLRRDFQAKGGPSLFVAQIQTGGLGITLHRSHQVIFYSVTYALDDYIQACDRVHRIGQEYKVTYRHIVARSTVDVDIYAALRRKQDIMKIIMDDHSKVAQYLDRPV